jgi:short-subunit dehydrogenase
MEDLKTRTALVTGASSGLGVAFARELAARGMNLVLVARRKDRLDALARELRSGASVDVRVEAVDLGSEEARVALASRLEADGVPVDVLVNNAGFGIYGRFADTAWERERDMLELDIVALTHLTKLFVKPMLARGFGRILQVSSIGAYQPSPTYAAYSAAKSYVLSFGEALNYELRGTGVSCTVLSPGVTATEFLEVARQAPTGYQRRAMMQAPEVVRIGLDAMLRGKGSVVPGLMNALGAALASRFLTRRAAAAIAAKTMEG